MPPKLQDLEKFVACYCNWPPHRKLRRYNLFIKGFHKNLDNALAYLVLGTNLQTAAEAATGVVLRIEGEVAWNVDVAKPHIRVCWRPTADLFQLPWSTFDPLIRKIAWLLPQQKRTAHGRALAVLLLEKLLPIYFQSAANIERAVAVLEDQLPNLILRTCPPPTNCPTHRANSINWSLSYDACRGFETSSVKGVSFLEMRYERDALVPPQEVRRMKSKLSKQIPCLQGPYRKCVVNFIWFGTGPPNSGNVGFANAIQKTQEPTEGVLVRYWCLGKMIPAFRKALVNGVQLLSIESLLWDARCEFGKSMADDVDEILAFYAANRGYAPAKDILSYLMLAIHGGFMFDGNCGVDKWGVFFEAMKESPRPAFIQLEDERPVDLHDPEPNLERLQYDFESPSSYHKTDMWALYAPRGCKMFPLIARRYVGLAKSLRLTGGVSAASRAFTRVQTQHNAKEVAQGKRAVAGALGIQSIFWGWNKTTDFNPSQGNWPTIDEPSESNRDYTVKCLGINKSHGGTW